MAINVEEIAKDLGVNVEKLLTESIIAYLEKSRRECQAMRLELMRKYNVSSAEELENKIRNGEVEEHPTWEDLITIENLEASIKEIEDELAGLRKAGPVTLSV